MFIGDWFLAVAERKHATVSARPYLTVYLNLKEGHMSPETRPGWKTTEFWLVVLANVLPELGAIDVGNAKIKGLLHLATVVGYALSRGLAKQGVANVAPVVEVPVGDGVKHQGI